MVAWCRELDARDVLDLGCGNGALTAAIAAAGFAVRGYDPSPSGIEIARGAHPDLTFVAASAYDEPRLEDIGRYDTVVSTEVIEHLYEPRALTRYAHAVLQPGGHLILSTPYWGYAKEVAVTFTNGWDRVHHPLKDGGHVKFWSRRTLTQLLNEEGFGVVAFRGAGRVPYLWKSMLFVAQKLEI